MLELDKIKQPKVLLRLIISLAIFLWISSLVPTIKIIQNLGLEKHLSITLFYQISKVYITGIASMSFILLWKQAVDELKILQEQVGIIDKTDFGILYLSLAMLCWGLSGDLGLWTYYYESIVKGHPSTLLSINVDSFDIILSSANNVFLLFTISTFKFGREPFWYNWPFISIWRSKKIVMIGFAMIVLFTMVSSLVGINKESVINFQAFPDYIFSNLTATLLLLYLKYGLPERGLSSLKYIFFFCILLTLVVQSFWLIPNTWKAIIPTDVTYLILLAYMLSLIFIFQALASSWKDYEKNKILERSKHKILDRTVKLKKKSKKLKKKNLENALLTRAMNHAIRGSLSNLDLDLKTIITQNYESGKNELSNLAQSIRDRVKNIHLLHNRLYEEQTGYISLESFFIELIGYFQLSHHYGKGELDFTINIGELHTSLSRARELGAIIVELSLNAYKAQWAYQDSKKGLIINIEKRTRIKEREEELVLYFSVKDKGPGIKDSYQSNFGLNYVKIIVDTFEGDFYKPTINEYGGTTFIIEIPINKIKLLKS